MESRIYNKMRANRRYGPLARIQIYEGIRRGVMDVMGVHGKLFYRM